MAEKPSTLRHIRAVFNSHEVVLALILLQLISLTQGATNFVPNVTVSTVDGVSFRYDIRDMKPHPSDPNSILLIDRHPLLSLNILSKQKSTVVGVTSFAGYVEGVGRHARFYYPSSFSITTENKIIVSDSDNACLREVDLSSHQTSRFAGTCQSRGYRNGPALQAQFNYPYGLLQYRTSLLIADPNNGAIRRLNGGVVSTLVEGSPVQDAFYFTQIEDTHYISTQTGVVKLDPDTGSVQLIAGDASSTGDSDGPLLSARFHLESDLVSLDSNLIILADRFNNRLRLVDLDNQTVTSICTGTEASVDGGSDRCQLLLPWSLLVLNKTIYMGERSKIRTIPLNSIVKKGENVAPTIIGCPANVTLAFPAGDSSVNYSWTEPAADGENIACDSCLSQPSGTFGIGSSEIVYTFRSAGGLTSTCSFYITVQDICPPAEINVSLRPGQKTAAVEMPGRTLILPSGEYQVISKLSNGTECLTSINITGGISTDTTTGLKGQNLRQRDIVYVAIGVGAVLLIVIVIVVTVIIARRAACKRNNESAHQTRPSSDSERHNQTDTRIDGEMEPEPEDYSYVNICDISEPPQGAHSAAPDEHLNVQRDSIHDYFQLDDRGNQTLYEDVNPETDTGITAEENI